MALVVQNKRNRTRNDEIIRLLFLGWTNSRIAAHLGISPFVVVCIKRSPFAQAELQRLKDIATERITDVPTRVALVDELRSAANEAVKLNRFVMNNELIDVKVRTGVAKHFMDRVIFDHQDDDEQQDTYRNLLRKLDGIQRNMEKAIIIKPGDRVTVDNNAPTEGAVEDRPALFDSQGQPDDKANSPVPR